MVTESVFLETESVYLLAGSFSITQPLRASRGSRFSQRCCGINKLHRYYRPTQLPLLPMTALEAAIIEVLKTVDDCETIPSPQVRAMLDPAVRPKGKNTCCMALMSLVGSGRVVRTGGDSKKKARYRLSSATGEPHNVYSLWPFVAAKRAF